VGARLIRMDRRSAAAPTTTVAAALKASAVTVDSLSQATDIPRATLRERLANEATFTWDELGRVGGFFRIHPTDLMVGAA
jgi:hypothetical protein